RDIRIEGADEIEDFWPDGANEDDIVDSQLLNSALESMNDVGTISDLRKTSISGCMKVIRTLDSDQDAAEISGGGPVFPRAEGFEGASKAQFLFEPACDAVELDAASKAEAPVHSEPRQAAIGSRYRPEESSYGERLLCGSAR
ncbi:hypothetical protein FOZ61_008592, partial [Perkinsus olseni]